MSRRSEATPVEADLQAGIDEQRALGRRRRAI
jgi:hypothetical protein